MNAGMTSPCQENEIAAANVTRWWAVAFFVCIISMLTGQILF